MKTILSTPIRKLLALGVSTLVCLVATSGIGRAQVDYTKGIDFNQNLGAQVPLDTPLRDESGKTVQLGSVFHGRPVILVPIAYRCQTACAMVTDSLLKTLTHMLKIPRAQLGESHYGLVGQDFDVVFVSIDPTEDDPSVAKQPEQMTSTIEGPSIVEGNGHVARDKKALILKAYEQPLSGDGWHLLTGTLDNVHRVTDAIGLKYFYNPKTDVIRNPTGIVFLTPTGKISSYILGTDYATSVLNVDVKQAAEEKVGSKSEKIMFVCFTPDADVARNRTIIEGIVRWASFATLVALVAFIIKLSLPDRKRPLGGGSALSSR